MNRLDDGIRDDSASIAGLGRLSARPMIECLFLFLEPAARTLWRFIDEDGQAIATEPDSRHYEDPLFEDIIRGKRLVVLTFPARLGGKEVGAVVAEIVYGETLCAVAETDRKEGLVIAATRPRQCK